MAVFQKYFWESIRRRCGRSWMQKIGVQKIFRACITFRWGTVMCNDQESALKFCLYSSFFVNFSHHNSLSILLPWISPINLLCLKSHLDEWSGGGGVREGSLLHVRHLELLWLKRLGCVCVWNLVRSMGCTERSEVNRLLTFNLTLNFHLRSDLYGTEHLEPFLGPLVPYIYCIYRHLASSCLVWMSEGYTDPSVHSDPPPCNK